MSTTSDDELQELSPDDAREIRAFLEKRRWFEGKLKILEGLAPIYPFVHPKISDASGDSAQLHYFGEDVMEWRLPNADRIPEWQAERNALEEEVLAFDGGDLGRMKEMTRAATILPLTPPSTHLVSITLDLILLVDRILTLLRHRCDLLELTSMRLQWDAMRWQIMQETSRIRAEIDEIRRTKGRWRPAGRSSQVPSETSLARSNASPSMVPLVSALPETSANSASESLQTPVKAATVTKHTRRRKSSISTAHTPDRDTPSKRSHHLTLLRSHITNLEVRRKNLSSTLVVRSGKILDRMIDLAIPLKGLGGVDGPEDNSVDESGAVPDDLLDIQDDLELKVTRTGQRIADCRELESQWERADTCHSKTYQAQEAADELWRNIQDALSFKPERMTLDRLQSTLRNTETALPPAARIEEYRSKLVAADADDDQATSIITILHDTRTQAVSSLQTCQSGLKWYEKLLAASSALDTAIEQARKGKARLEYLQLAVLARNPDWADHDTMRTAVLSSFEADMRPLVQDLQAAQQVKDAQQHLVLSIMTYRQALATPGHLHAQVDFDLSEEQIDEAQSVVDTLITLQDDTRPLIATVEADIAVVEAVIDFTRSTERSQAVLCNLGRLLQGDEPEFRSTQRYVDEGWQLVREELPRKLEAVEAMLASQIRTIPHLADMVIHLTTEITSTFGRLTARVVLVDRCRAQKVLVAQIETEALDLIARIQQVQAIADAGDGLLEPYEQLHGEVDNWDSLLADRMVWTADEATRSGFHVLPVSLRLPTTSAADPPMTPPASPPRVGSPDRSSPTLPIIETIRLDQESRARVNESSSRVRAALASLNSLITSHQTQPPVGTIPHMNGGTASDDVFGPTMAQPTVSLASTSPIALLQQLKAIGLDTTVNPSPEDIQSTPSLRRLPTPGKVTRIQAEIAAISTELLRLSSASRETSERNAYEEAKVILAASHANLAQLSALGVFAAAVEQTDKAFSNLLVGLDDHAHQPVPAVLDAKDETAISVQSVLSLSAPVIGDERVKREVKRIETAWHELTALIHEERPESAMDVLADGGETASQTSAVSATAGTEPAGTTTEHRHRLDLIASLGHPRNRAVSDTPTRMRTGLPRLRKHSLQPSTTFEASQMPPSPRIGSSAIPRPTRLSLATSSRPTPPATAQRPTTPIAKRPIRLSGLARSAIKPKKAYVPDSRSKLDVAVGKIVNTLDINVPIRPVGADAGEEWKDQSGKYWIGAEGRAKLCFCRILRSKMVMVRVGGGWVELSKFLLDHFADSLGSWQPTPKTGIGLGPSVPVSITSASLSTPSRSRPAPPLPQPPVLEVSPVLPVIPLPRSYSQDLLTPQRPRYSDTLSPGSSAGGSPLVPLHFIRKASESPPVREKEREKFGAGKRSILGRSNSGLSQ